MQINLKQCSYKPDYHVKGLVESHVDFLMKPGDESSNLR